jgi:AraC-like DNA-binding protein
LQAFGMPVEFGCDLDGIVCDARDLDAPLPLADPQLAHYLNQHFAGLIETSNESIAGKVRRIVWTLLPQGQCTAVRVAGQLGIERTTLHRQLAQTGQSFSTIVDAVRAELVPRYLANPERPLTNVAALLGFASLSTFSRWFKLRYGENPSRWRQISDP